HIKRIPPNRRRQHRRRKRPHPIFSLGHRRPIERKIPHNPHRRRPRRLQPKRHLAVRPHLRRHHIPRVRRIRRQPSCRGKPSPRNHRHRHRGQTHNITIHAKLLGFTTHIEWDITRKSRLSCTAYRPGRNPFASVPKRLPPDSNL